MNLSNHTPQPADLSGVFSTEINRRTQLEQLFLANYSTLREAVQDAGPNLLYQDLDRILESLSERLDSYHGDPSGFIEWAVNTAQDAAHLATTFLEMRNDAGNVEAVRKALGSILKGCDGLGVDGDTLDELESDFWCSVLSNLEEWLMPSWSKDGKRQAATMPTRLFGAAMWQARAWKTTRTREKERYAEPEALESSRVCGNKVECPVEF